MRAQHFEAIPRLILLPHSECNDAGTIAGEIVLSSAHDRLALAPEAALVKRDEPCRLQLRRHVLDNMKRFGTGIEKFGTLFNTVADSFT